MLSIEYVIFAMLLVLLLLLLLLLLQCYYNNYYIIVVGFFFSLKRKGHDFSKAAKVMPNKVIGMTNTRDTSLYLYEVAAAKIGLKNFDSAD